MHYKSDLLLHEKFATATRHWKEYTTVHNDICLNYITIMFQRQHKITDISEARKVSEGNIDIAHFIYFIRIIINCYIAIKYSFKRQKHPRRPKYWTCLKCLA